MSRPVNDKTIHDDFEYAREAVLHLLTDMVHYGVQNGLDIKHVHADLVSMYSDLMTHENRLHDLAQVQSLDWDISFDITDDDDPYIDEDTQRGDR